MDDPLKPKAVPLAAETVLWFEFLLDPELITKHLKKINPDPSALELLLQFISMTPDNMVVPQFDLTSAEPTVMPMVPPVIAPNVEALRLTRKQLAFKSISFKAGEGNEKAAKFALTFYHRWVLRLQILKDIAIKAARPNMELKDLLQQIQEPELPHATLAMLSEWKFSSKMPLATNPSKPLWTVNPSWEIATPIKSVLMSMQRGFLQDFAYVLLGKARELTAKGIIESCALMLLNLNDWNTIMLLDKRLPQLELPIAFAATFLDMENERS
ncbi:Integrator complex subunit 8 [Eumeta japonica]|uniref:Integrator complex subunit 8 n=1 Tax=Eumeta variegata TaxID=151549 RepID=A0A4C1SSA7_EUMVA|nr:Integrator complex subunit 8 [Eumeta japonica]